MISFIWFLNVCNLPVHIHEDAIIADSCHLALLLLLLLKRGKSGSKCGGNKMNKEEQINKCVINVVVVFVIIFAFALRYFL